MRNRLKKFYPREYPRANDEGSATGQPSYGDDPADVDGSGTMGEASEYVDLDNESGDV